MNGLLQGKCICNNSDIRRFWLLRSLDNNGLGQDVWGVCCQKRKCHTEFLIDRFSLTYGATDANRNQLVWNDQTLIQAEPLTPPRYSGFQASLQRVRVRTIQQLCKGDQIIWRRICCIWQHGIVTKVNSNNFEVVHWAKVSKTKMQIERALLTESDLGRAFKIDYSTVYAQTNDRGRELSLDTRRDLVVSRAYSRLLSDANQPSILRLVKIKGEYDYDYAYLNENNEQFANYCAQGTESGYQWRAIRYVTKFMANSLRKSTGRSVLKAIFILIAEAFENGKRFQEIVGASVVASVECIEFIGYMFILGSLCKKGLVSRGVCVNEVVKHLFGIILAVAFAFMVGSLLGHMPCLEVFLTPVVALLMKFIGMQLGFEVGLCMTDKCIERD